MRPGGPPCECVRRNVKSGKLDGRENFFDVEGHRENSQLPERSRLFLLLLFYKVIESDRVDSEGDKRAITRLIRVREYTSDRAIAAAKFGSDILRCTFSL